MAINYLIKWIDELEKNFYDTKDFAKALVKKDTSDYYESKGYVKKLIELRGKMARTRITSVTDAINLISDVSKDGDISRMFAIEKAISFVENFDSQKENLVKLMKAIDKHIRIPTKSKVFEKLGIKYTVKLSNTIKPQMKFSDLFEGDSEKIDTGDLRGWSKRLPFWRIDYEIPLKHIRVRSTIKRQEDESFDFKIPYDSVCHIGFGLHCNNMQKFFFTNIAKVEYYISKPGDACADLFTRTVEDRDRYFRDTNLIMRDEHLDGGNWSRFQGHVHPYMTSSRHMEGSSSNYCTGDVNDELDKAYRNLEFEKLALIVHDWLSNFIVGHTSPLNNINHFLLGGMPEDWGTNVEKYHFDSDWQRVCYTDRMKDHRLCEARKCAARSYCEPYIMNANKSGEETTEIVERTIQNVMKRHENWLIRFNTSLDLNHRVEIENILVNSRDADDFNSVLSDMENREIDRFAVSQTQFEDLNWYFLNKSGDEGSP